MHNIRLWDTDVKKRRLEKNTLEVNRYALTRQTLRHAALGERFECCREAGHDARDLVVVQIQEGSQFCHQVRVVFDESFECLNARLQPQADFIEAHTTFKLTIHKQSSQQAAFLIAVVGAVRLHRLERHEDRCHLGGLLEVLAAREQIERSRAFGKRREDFHPSLECPEFFDNCIQALALIGELHVKHNRAATLECGPKQHRAKQACRLAASWWTVDERVLVEIGFGHTQRLVIPIAPQGLRNRLEIRNQTEHSDQPRAWFGLLVAFEFLTCRPPPSSYRRVSRIAFEDLQQYPRHRNQHEW